MTTSNSKKIQDICSIFYQTSEVPTAFIDFTGKVTFDKGHNMLKKYGFVNIRKLFKQKRQDSIIDNQPFFFTDHLWGNYFSIDCVLNDVFIGSFVCGPFLGSELTETTIKQMVIDGKVKGHALQNLRRHYALLKVLSMADQSKFFALLYYLVKDEIYDKSNPSYQFEGEGETRDKEDAKVEYSFQHHKYISELLQLRSLKYGDIQDRWDFKELLDDGRNGTLSQNPLRNMKNLGISATSIVCRLAIESGLDSETAYTMSDNIIERIEQAKTMNELSNLMHHINRTYSKSIQKLYEDKYSKPIRDCILYITRNLTSELSLKVISDYADLTPQYMCTLFKKETGLTVTQFINQEKIEIAKDLLSHTDLPIMDISLLLNYGDHSYFTRIFKKHTGLSPLKYRNGNIYSKG